MSNPLPNDDDLLTFIAATIESMRDQMATKSDLERMATKSDIARLEVQLTAVRGDIEQVHLRLDSIERALTARLSQIETEVSRLRSVVYLLVKDKPEMLRLLGQTPPAGGEDRP
jgi:outer membrane protein TolC